MLSETKSVKSNLHKPTINKVPPSSGIFNFPSVVQGTETSPLLPNKEPLDDVADVQKEACARMNTDLFNPTWAITESAAFYRLPREKSMCI